MLEENLPGVQSRGDVQGMRSPPGAEKETKSGGEAAGEAVEGQGEGLGVPFIGVTPAGTLGTAGVTDLTLSGWWRTGRSPECPGLGE